MLKLLAHKRRFLPLTLDQLGSPKAFSISDWLFPQNAIYHHFEATPLAANSPLILQESSVTIYPVTEIRQDFLKGRLTPQPLRSKTETYLKTLERPLLRGRNMKRDLVSLSTLPIKDYHLLDAAVVYTRDTSDDAQNLRFTLQAAQNRLATLLGELGKEDLATADVVVLKAPDTVPTLAELKRLENDIPTPKIQAWLSTSSLLLRELHKALVTENHPLRNLNRPFIVALERHGQLAALDVREFFDYFEQAGERAERLLLQFFQSVSSIEANKALSNNHALDADDVEDLGEETEQTLITTTNEHGDEIQVYADDLAIESEGVTRTVRKQQTQRPLTKKELKRLEKLANQHTKITGFNGKESLVKEIATAKTKVNARLYENKVRDVKAITDKSLLINSSKELTAHYIENGIMEADVASACLALNKMGYMVQDVQRENVGDALNDIYRYTVKVTTVNGVNTSMRFDLPAMNKDGIYIANGVKTRMVNQKVDLPIRKVAPDKVALTSDYGKVGIMRSPYQAFSLNGWFAKRITAQAMLDKDAERVLTNVKLTNGTVPKLPLSRTFTAIGQSCSKFTAQTVEFVFSLSGAEELVGKELFHKTLERKLTLCGKGKDGSLYALDRRGGLVRTVNGKPEMLGPFENWLNPEWGTAPSEFINVNVRGRAVPVILFAGYVFASLADLSPWVKSKDIKPGSQGLQAALEFFNVTHRWANKGTRAEADELVVRFDTEALYIKKDKPETVIVAAGLNRLANVMRLMSPTDFNSPGAYGELMEAFKYRRSLLDEITLMEEAFVDPITEDLLREMGEPTDFLPLLRRAAEMLVDDDHTDETDRRYMRDRGAERMAGILYRNILDSVREHRSQPYPERTGPSLPYKKVWNDIITDQAKALVEESNPLHNLKEMESLTYTGIGGRSSRTMTEKTRRFLDSDVGGMSEAVPDSSKVGVRAYAPPAIKYNSVRGTLDPYNVKADGPSGGVSSVSLMNPGTMNMDPKRANLASVQASSMVSCAGGQLLPIRTGYEMTVHARCGDAFGVVALEDGKITEVSKNQLVIRYVDKGETRYPLGVKHGEAAGAILPHQLTTDLKVGDSVKTGEALTWNPAYFERDILNPGGVSMKGGYLARVAYKDDAETLEDSSWISEHCSQKLATPISSRVTVLVKFTDEIRDIVNVGSGVLAEDVLVRVEDGIVAGLSANDAALAGIEKLSAKLPKAGLQGQIGHIEVVYQGKIESMSSSLQELAKADNRRRAREAKMEGRSKATTGEIAQTTFVNKEKVTPNTAAITFYVDAVLPAQVGDKGVIDNPLKTIFGGVMSNRNRTEGGRPIDIKFAFQSVDNRILYSAIRYTVGNTYLVEASKDVARIYRGA